MRATFLKSPSETSRVRPSLRFTFGDFEVRMCRFCAWPRLILPVPVLLKRFFAPVWVFNLGILFLVSEGWIHPKASMQGRGFPARMRLHPVYRNPALNGLRTADAAYFAFILGAAAGTGGTASGLGLGASCFLDAARIACRMVPSMRGMNSTMAASPTS